MEDYINFILWQKLFSNENLMNLFRGYLNEKVEKDKKSILVKWKQIENLLDEIKKELELKS
jgi:hypothetical protein